MAHPQRLEDSTTHEIQKRLASGPLDEGTEQNESVRRVVVLLTGTRQKGVVSEDAEGIGNVVIVALAEEFLIRVVTNAGEVPRYLSTRNRVTLLRKRRNVALHRSVEVKLAALD